MRYVMAIIVLLSSASTLAGKAGSCPAACDRPKDCSKQFYIDGKRVKYYSNYPLNKFNSCIDSVVYAVHGSERNVESTYDQVLDSAKSLRKERNVLIIAPYFRTDEDAPTAEDYFWSSSGWKQGNTSNNAGDDISSFEFADAILADVLDGGKFPLISSATVTGHSAGGQYTQMYALTTTAPADHPEVDFQFLVMNPSNYSYLNEYRPYPYISNYFDVPVYWSGSSWRMKLDYQMVAGNCPTSFNNYKYGLKDRNYYASRLSAEALIEQYLPRRVVYLLGELDNDPDHVSLDTSCSAELQGPHRLARGHNYYDFLNTFFPSHQHDIATVPGVGHEARAMYNSSVVKPILFGF